MEKRQKRERNQRIVSSQTIVDTSAAPFLRKIEVITTPPAIGFTQIL